jgi:hypothetical protein
VGGGALTCSLIEPEVAGPVGRAEPPQPLREVSISIPMFDGIPCVISSWRNAWTNVPGLVVDMQGPVRGG